MMAADRVGREQLGPEISRSFADIFQLQLMHNPDDTLAFQALANSIVKHYQIQEMALYNSNNQRIIYACSKICINGLPATIDLQKDLIDNRFIYQLNKQDQSEIFNLIIETSTELSEFFFADTLSTALLIVSISTLFLFFLYRENLRPAFFSGY